MPEAVAARDKHGDRKGRGDTRDPDSKRHASISVERRSKKSAIESTNTPNNSTPVDTRRHTTSSSNPPLSSTSGSTSFKSINSNPIVADPSNSTSGTRSQPKVTENEKDKKRLYKCQEKGCEGLRKFSLKDLRRHHNDRHVENPDMFSCELKECKFESKRKDHLTRHYKSATHEKALLRVNKTN